MGSDSRSMTRPAPTLNHIKLNGGQGTAEIVWRVVFLSIFIVLGVDRVLEKREPILGGMYLLVGGVGIYLVIRMIVPPENSYAPWHRHLVPVAGPGSPESGPTGATHWSSSNLRR